MFKFIKNIIETIGQKIKEKKQKQEELRKKLLNIDILKDETTKMFLNGNLVISEASNYIEKRRID
jgi:D-Tyr-tRNAtyr deacylase